LACILRRELFARAGLAFLAVCPASGPQSGAFDLDQVERFEGAPRYISRRRNNSIASGAKDHRYVRI